MEREKEREREGKKDRDTYREIQMTTATLTNSAGAIVQDLCFITYFMSVSCTCLAELRSTPTAS